MKLYVCPRDWEGRTVAVVASGCSVLEFDFARIAGMPVIAVKDGYKLVPEADVLMVGDHRYVFRNPDFSDYKGPLILYTDPKPLPDSWKQDDRIRFIPKVMGGGLSQNPRELRGTFTTTALAINLAVLRGAKRILLIGVDGHAGPNNERHFTGFLSEDWHMRYGRQKWGLGRLPRDLKPLGVEVFNLNKRSSIKTFPYLKPGQENG